MRTVKEIIEQNRDILLKIEKEQRGADLLKLLRDEFDKININHSINRAVIGDMSNFINLENNLSLKYELNYSIQYIQKYNGIDVEIISNPSRDKTQIEETIKCIRDILIAETVNN